MIEIKQKGFEQYAKGDLSSIPFFSQDGATVAASSGVLQ